MARPVVLRFLGDTTQLTRSFNATAAQSAALSSQIGALNSKLASGSQTMIAAGATLSRRFTLPIAYATSASAFLASTFEQSMTKIETLAGESRGQVQAWSEDILQLARILPESPQKLADALYFIASSGIDATQALDVLTVSAKGSTVGLGSTKIVADALTSAINAYGIENLNAARAADILIGAVREGKGEAKDFAGSIGRVIAPAQLLGVSFDQVAAAMSSMTLVGLSADESATALRQIFFTLAKPSAQVAGALADIGLSADQVRASIREKGLLTTLGDLRAKVGDNDEILTNMFPNIRAFNGLTIMTGENMGNTARIFSQLAGESGSLDSAFKRTTENSAFKFEMALNRLRLIGIDIGANVLPLLVENVTRIADALLRGWESLSPAAQSLVINIGLIVAAVGPLLRILGNLGALLSLIAAHPVVAAIAAIALGFYLAYTRIEPFRNAVDAVVRFLRDHLREVLISIGVLIANVFLPGIAPLVALGAAFYNAYQNIEPFRNAVDAVARIIRDALMSALDWLKRFGPEAWQFLQTAAQSALSTIRGVGAAIGRVFVSMKNAAMPVVQWFVQWVGPVLTETFGLIGDVFQLTFEVMSESFDFFMSVARPVFNELRSLIDLWLIGMQVFWAFAQPMLEGLARAFMDLLGNLRGVIEFAITGFDAMWKVVQPILALIANVIETVVIAAFNNVKVVVEGFLQVITGVIQVIRGVITGDWSKAWEGIKNIFGGVWNGIAGTLRTSLDTIVGFISGLPGRILAILVGLKDAGLQLGSAFITGLVDGIKGIASAAVNIASGFTEAMMNALKTGWNKIIDWLNQRTNGMEIDPPGPGPTFGLPDNMWNFLRFANGGIVSSPTFAMIGEAGTEAVIPLTRPTRAAAIMREAGLLPETRQAQQSSGPSVVVNQQIYALDPHEAARRADMDWQWAMKTMSGR